MSEMIKRRVTPLVGAAIVTLLVLGAVFAGLQIQEVQAVDEGGVTSNVTIYDTNSNGKIDRIEFNITNVNTETWAVNGTPGLTVTDNTVDIDVTTIEIIGSVTANPVLVRVTLNESDTDLTVNTAVASGIELVYAQAGGGGGCTNCIKDGDEELNTIATGDSDGTDTEVDAASPVLVSQNYKDTNGDGAINRLDLTFSEAIAEDEFEAGDYTLSGADTGSLVVASSAQATTDLRLTLTGGAANDTNITLSVAYDKDAGVTSSLDDAAGNAVADISASVLADAASPVPTAFAYKDVDLDGAVDRIDVTFTEDIAYDECDAADYTMAGADVGTLAVASCATSSADLQLTMSGGATEDTSLTITMAYTAANGTADSLDDAAGNAVADKGATAVTDAAAPHISTVQFEDTAVDGLIDKLTFTWSENIDTDDSVPPVIADFGTITLPDGQAVSSATISDPAGASAAVTLTSVVGQVTENTASGSIAIAGITNEWTGATVATVDPDGAIGFGDAAKPHISTIAFSDSALDGLIDTLAVTFSENVDTNDGAAPIIGDFGTITLPDGQTVSSATISDPAGASAVVTLTSVVGQVTENTAAGSIAIAGVTGEWEDANALETTDPDAGVAFTDSAAPHISTVAFEDTAADGLIDKLTVTFSEIVDTNDGAAPIIGDFGTITLPDGQTVSSASITDPAGASAAVTLTSIVGQVTENTAAGSIAIAGITTEWEDAGALETTNPDGAIAFTDSAKPHISTIAFADSALDGLIDTLTVTWSENVDTNDGVAPIIGDFGTITLPDGQTVSSATISDPAGATPTVTLTAVVGQVTENTAAGSIAIAGITTEWEDAGALETTDPDTSVAFTDAAAPHISTVAFADAALDGLIDTLTVTFSENVDTNDGVAPVIADFGTITLPDGQTASSATISDPAGATPTVTLTSIVGQATENTAVGSLAIAGITTEWEDAGALETANPDGSIAFTDAAAPHISTVTFSDQNDNGKIDKLIVVFSENVDTNDGVAPVIADFGTITMPDGQTVVSATITDPAGATPTVTLTAVVGQVAPNTAVGSMAIAGIATEWEDAGALETTNPDGAITFTDAASPIILSAVYLDADVNGAVDTIRTTWSEIVTQDADAAVTDYTIVAGDITAVFSSSAADTSGDALIDITVTADAEETGVNGGTEPTLLYVAGQQDPVHDAAASPNDAVARAAGAVTVTDTAAPHLSTMEIKDSGTADGLINEIVMTFSEWVDTNDSAAPIIGDFGTILLPDGVAVTAATITDPAAASAVVTLTAIADQVAENTAAGSTAISGITTEWKDGSSNATANPDTGVVVTDSAAPHISTVAFLDSATTDGLIDSLVVTFSEIVDTNDGVAPVLADFGTITMPDGVAATSATISDPAGASAVVTLTAIVGQATENTAVGSLAIAGITTEWEDAGALETTDPDAGISFLDNAKPVIVSTTPTDDSTAQSRTNAVAFTFSEAMTATAWVEGTTGFDSTPNSSSWSGTWSGAGNLTYTLTHTPFLCVTEYIMTTTEADIVPTAGEAGYLTLSEGGGGNAFDGTLTFSSMSCGTSSGGGGGGGGSSAAADRITVEAPNGGEALTIGQEYDITWETTDYGDNYVDILYLNSEGTYTEIATQEENDESYTWLVPDDAMEGSMIKLEWNDLADVMDDDVSDDGFDIVSGDATTTDDSDDTDTSTSDAVAPSGTGVSPVTGEAEEITAVEPGDFITSPSFSTVYYVTADYGRRAFISSAVFFTYADSYDEVTDVTDATLTELGLTSNMLPNPGVVLVKVQSDAKTYAVDDDSNLRWITSEEVAVDLYGDSWADYIIDVEATFFSAFGAGDDVESSDDLTVSDSMKTRVEVSQ